MIEGITHTAISVSDLDRSLAFFRDVLGLDVLWEDEMKGEAIEKDVGIPDAHIRMAVVGTGGQQIELIQWLCPKGRPRGPDHKICDLGPSHVCFCVDDIEATRADWVQKGVAFLTDINLLGAIKTSFFQDPDGFVYEIVEFPK